jgi:outer membrane protein OmpA-like peptidoglycan-associated protein
MNIFYKHKNLIWLFAAVIFFATSCSSSKRAAIAKVIAAAKNTQQNNAARQSDAAKLAAMQQKKDEKAAEEKIDSIVNANIAAKINDYKNNLNSFSNSVNFIDSVIQTNKLFRKNKKEIKIQLKLVDNYIKDTKLRLQRFAMIDDGLNISQQYLFNLGAYFGGGKYEIPTDKLEQAQQSFAPILDSISNFYNRYNNIERFATITVLGFADGTGFNKEGQTYKTLVALLKDSLAGKEMINQKISELRAKNMADVMEAILYKKIPNYTNIRTLDFLFLEIGKGETLPSKKITDYAVDDERRRVVLLFWNILPK